MSSLNEKFENPLAKPFAISNLGGILITAVQLAGIYIVVNWYQLESNLELPKLMPLVLIAFVIHAMMKSNMRQLVFVLAGIAGAVLLLGFKEATVLLALFSLVFVTVHLPLNLRIRILMIFLIGIILAILRIGLIPDLIPPFTIALLGYLYMFRMILYLYELKYETDKVSLWTRTSYFLMLPNLFFPIFPIVDYKTFKNTYYNEEEFKIYQRGIHLMTLGMIHLMIYRIIYQVLLPEAVSPSNLNELIYYIILSYLMIFRLSGIFHFCVGLLCLFGFNLPPIFKDFLLSNGMSDLWRRVNIYWKDFMLKIFYYPLFFRFKKHGIRFAVVIATLITFVFNWFFHSYQWFWILGDFPITETDVIFWSVFGIMVAISAISRKKSIKKKSRWTNSFNEVFKITGTFCLVAVIWSLWISPSFAQWTDMISVGSHTTPMDILLLISVFLTFILLAGISYYYLNYRIVLSEWIEKNKAKLYPYKNSLVIAAFLFTGSYIGLKCIKMSLGYDLSALKLNKLNVMDEEQLFNGYYDKLLYNNFTSQNWQLKRKEFMWRRAHEGVMQSDFLGKTHKPSYVSKTEDFRINEHGLRDKSYSLIPPPNTIRIALVGGSWVLGRNIKDQDVFENVMENMLNDKFGNDSMHYEVLNFGMAGLSGFGTQYMVMAKIDQFKPDLLLYVEHNTGKKTLSRQVVRAIRDKRLNTIPEYLKDYLEGIGIDLNQKAEKVELQVIDNYQNVYSWIMTSIADYCALHSIQPVWVYIPRLFPVDAKTYKLSNHLPIIEKSGFYPIILDHIWDGRSFEDLHLAADDFHPNTEGHRIIAENLYVELVNYLNLNLDTSN